MLIPLGILASSGGGAAGSFELISTTILGSNQTSVTLDISGLSATYKHLQIRMAARQIGDGFGGMDMRANSDSGSNYSMHRLWGNGSSVSSNANTSQTMAQIAYLNRSNSSDAFTGVVLDILDPYSTNKNKTFRTLFGVPNTSSGNYNGIFSGAWYSTSAMTSITLYADSGGGTFGTNSRFSIYGIKG
jgi:hypothetical protein